MTIRFQILACVVAFHLWGAAQETKPNILFIYTDDMTFDSIRSLGNPEVKTPNLDRLATSGSAFLNCYNQGGWHGAICVASRTMLNTGRSLWRACNIEKQLKREVSQNHFFAQMMGSAGYRTYMTGKWHITGVKPETVFDVATHVRPGMPGSCKEAYNRPKNEEDDLWKPWDTARGGFWEGGTHWSIVTANDAIGAIQEKRADGKPFFIYAAFNAPHDPRQSPKEFVDQYPPEKIALPPNFMPSNPHKDDIGCPHSLRDENLAPDPRTPYSIQVHRAEYYALITHLDLQIGRILDALESAGLREKTVVILTGDNGLSVGQHGFMGKQNMFEHSLKVPLLMSGPGIPKNKRFTTPVYLQDVLPTALQLAGQQVPPQVEFKSLLPVLKDDTTMHYDAIYGAYMKQQRMVRVGNMKLIWYPKNNLFLLFDLEKDPHEMKDLSSDPAHAQTVRTLKARLAKLQAEMDDPLPPCQ
jgi:arylsulfatase A-like enzyme